MARRGLSPLVNRLDATARRAFEIAVGRAVERGHVEVTIAHVVDALLEPPAGLFARVCQRAGVDRAGVRRAIEGSLAAIEGGHAGRPVFSPPVKSWLEAAWMAATLELGVQSIGHGALLLALVESVDALTAPGELGALADVDAELIRAVAAEAKARAAASPIGAGTTLAPDSALARFAINFTERARQDAIDPVFGRSREIRQVIDILARRRKNNPIIVADAGVGKTALVEGLAVQIAAGDVPDVLLDVELVGLDLGLLQAGAGVRGEFEQRLGTIIEEVAAFPRPIILFIDEAHMLIGAGGAQGQGDAANLLKPALARGELRTIAATTWSEYKRSFEKDAALSRRFQLVKLEEPDDDAALLMLRGLRPRYERAHEVVIRDDALTAAVRFGSRYLEGRHHPDKGIDLIDTAGARVRIARTSRPAVLRDADAQLAALIREREALQRDRDLSAVGDTERAARIEAAIDELRAASGIVDEAWRAELVAAEAVFEARRTFEAVPEGETPDDAHEAARTEVEQALTALRALQGDPPLVEVEVTPSIIAQVVSDWTGVPAGKMLSDEAGSLLSLEDTLRARIRGQDHALTSIAARLRASRAGLGEPNAPMGVFLLVGPSGVGKTETALGVADVIFGGDRFLTSINMTEFQEKHTVSRLIGSPPGYVGYGEGGVLTEAVRQRPYSVVLLDEVEKAHPDVMNLFYQVFDKGVLADGEGRVILFKDTVIFMTSNLGADLIHTSAAANEGKPDEAELMAEAVRPVLRDWFKAALLARMSVVAYRPLGREVMREVADLKLHRIADRLSGAHNVSVRVDDRAADRLAERARDPTTGARALDHVLNEEVLPALSGAVLARMAEGRRPEPLAIDVDGTGAFVVRTDIESGASGHGVASSSARM